MRTETISETEQSAYAERVLRDLSLTIDGRRLRLRLLSMQFPNIEEMKEGLGEIQIEFGADAACAAGPTEDSFSKTITKAESRHTW